MANYTLSCIKDVDGNAYNIKAKGLENQVTLSLTGDVTGSQTTTFDTGTTTSIAATIGTGKVTTEKIADSAVTTAKIANEAVTFGKIEPAVYSGSVGEGSASKLATHSGVKTYVEGVISGQGTYKGVQTVATINTWIAANLNNGDRVICSDAGTITLGGLIVTAGQECVFYKTSETQVWQSSAGAYKLKQSPTTDPGASGNGLTFIATITQNANGEIHATKTNITTATSNNDGLMTAANVTKLVGISTGANKVEASTNGKIKIDGTDTTVYTHPTYSIASAAAKKIGRDSTGHVVIGDTLAVADISGLSSALAGKQAAGNYKTTQTAVSVTGSGLQYIQSISQGTNGDITATLGTIRDGNTDQTGVVRLQNSLDGTTTKAVTPNAVNSAITNKMYLNATLLTSSVSLDSYPGSATMRNAWYYWASSSVPDNAPVSSSPSVMQSVFLINSSGNYSVQTVWAANGSRWCRTCSAGTWTSWKQQYYEATSTYSATGTQMVNGTAVAAAINTLSATKESSDGTNVQAKVTETNGKITAVNITTDNTENKNNKVSAFQTTPDDTHYPTEKLVYGALQGKKNVQNPVSMPTTVTDTGLNFVSRVTQNDQGVITPVLGTVQTATTGQYGITELVSTASASSTDETKAITPKGVAATIATLNKNDSAESYQFVTSVSEANGKLTNITRRQPVIADVDGLTSALAGKESTLTLSFSTTDNSLTINKQITVG